MTGVRATRPAPALALLLLGLLGLVGLVMAPAANAAGVDEVAAALRAGDIVYVEPGAEGTLSSQQAEDLREQARATGVPMFIAVLTPQTAKTVGDGSPDSALRAVHDDVRLAGVYALYAGDAFRAGASAGASVASIASAAKQQHDTDGPAAVLRAFVAQVGEARTGRTGEPSDPGSALVPLAIGAVVLGGGGYWLYRRSQRAEAEKVAAVRRTIDEDVTAYGELVAGLDTDDPKLGVAGGADAQRALDAYERAKAAADAMVRAEQAADVTSALEDGRFAAACVEARIAGRPLPERRPPCFVDPRHGPSTEDVEWAPNGGAPRPVPVCTACATALQDGQLPEARQVEVGGQRVPYWQAGAAYQPYASGYYSSFGASLLPVILVGSVLGDSLGGGYPDGGPAGGDPGSGDDFGGGDFGGDDFGGGDFGGGGDF